MVDKQEIILRYKLERHSIRRISRDLGVNRETVKKYITSCQQSQNKLEEQGPAASTAIKEELVKASIYDSFTRVKWKLTNDLQVLIDYYLE